MLSFEHLRSPSEPFVEDAIARGVAHLRRAIAGVVGQLDGSPRKVVVRLDAAELGPVVAWFAATPAHLPACYFASRDGGTELSALGVSRTTSAAGAATAPDGWRFFGGPSFDADVDERCFAAPCVEVALVQGEATLAAYLVGPTDDALERVDEVLHALECERLHPPRRGTTPTLVAREETPDRDTWSIMIGRALGAIRAGELDKVVLARRVALTFAEPVAPVALLAALSAREPRSFRFARRVGGTTWVGASPERLYARRGRRVVSEALAGTRRAMGIDARRQAGEALMASEKDRREHALVVDGVIAGLTPLSVPSMGVGAADAPTLLETSRLLHLWTPIHATVQAGVGDTELLAALHPTPATCGAPRAAARRLLGQLEPFARGPFTAPIGWISRDAAELAVGLRAAEVSGTRVVLTAGAGVVAGSEAEAEWQEIDGKLEGLLAALELAP